MPLAVTTARVTVQVMMTKRIQTGLIVKRLFSFGGAREKNTQKNAAFKDGSEEVLKSYSRIHVISMGKNITEKNVRGKWNTISEIVAEKYHDSVKKNEIIRDEILQQWAMEAARDIQFNEFKASHTWLLKFKQRNNIVSRKVTKFTTAKKQKNEAQVIIDGELFVACMQDKIDYFGTDYVYNADQSSFILEMTYKT